MQDEISKMKEQLSKKVEDAVSGMNDGTKDTTSDVGWGEHAHGKGMYSNMGFDYGQLIKGPTLYSPSVNLMIPTDKDREIIPEEAFNLHQNAQAMSLLVSSLGLNEFNKVNGMKSAKQIWEALRTSFEGDKSVRKGNIELLHGELERFVFLQGETTQAMFDRLMALVNHIRTLGST